jgi:hypothetical protein
VKEVNGKILCSHCAKPPEFRHGSYHKHENDEYICNCEGATKELALREEQAKLNHQVYNIESKIEALVKESAPILREAEYQAALSELNRKFKKNPNNVVV